LYGTYPEIWGADDARDAIYHFTFPRSATLDDVVSRHGQRTKRLLGKISARLSRIHAAVCLLKLLA
jgi:hypothetical protein